MKVIVKARHMDLTPSLKAHAEEKLGKAFMRIFDRPALKLEIELSELGKTKDGMDKECRATVSMPKGKTIVISEIADDMYKAVDLAHDRLLEQVKRQRSKRRSTGRNRKVAEQERDATARKNLTADQEEWEQEVQEFERSTARA
ncbi:MAG: ribosome-associated translation inhibitor RaiA [Myxococcota bacterium]